MWHSKCYINAKLSQKKVTERCSSVCWRMTMKSHKLLYWSWSIFTKLISLVPEELTLWDDGQSMAKCSTNWFINKSMTHIHNEIHAPSLFEINYPWAIWSCRNYTFQWQDSRLLNDSNFSNICFFLTLALEEYWWTISVRTNIKRRQQWLTGSWTQVIHILQVSSDKTVQK